MIRVLRGLKFLFVKMVASFPSQFIRKRIFILLGMKVGRRSVIHLGVEVRNPSGVTLGDGVLVGHKCVLDGRYGLSVGNEVNFSHEVWIWTAQHDLRSPSFAIEGDEVTIGDRCWLGGRVIVLPGVVIGEGAVVASGAVVTKDVEPWTVVAGIPAKPIGKRPEGMAYKLECGMALV